MAGQKPIQAPKGVRLFKDAPMLVRRSEATRFLWGDEESHQVSDVIYGSGDRISCLTYSLRPGEYFKASKTWKPLYDQHRFYYVVQGELAIHDPQSGEVAVAKAGEAIHWRGAKWHFGYNFGQQETIVLDWYAPQEHPPTVPEVELSVKKPDLAGVVYGRHDLIGRWPAALPEVEAQLCKQGGMVTLRQENALNLILGERNPILVSLYVSTEAITAGVVRLRPSVAGENESHRGDKVIYVTRGRLHVYLPDSFDWFEINVADVLYLPEGIKHQYHNHSDALVEFAFAVAPSYRSSPTADSPT